MFRSERLAGTSRCGQENRQAGDRPRGRSDRLSLVRPPASCCDDGSDQTLLAMGETLRNRQIGPVKDSSLA
ncbi:hypothetical protein, partial [Streptococcus pneumoniae]|uniref:hypothetical protein n=1 Tax=Streptococcus pneumoniae TaxID=1313 RepID=UPI0019539430